MWGWEIAERWVALLPSALPLAMAGAALAAVAVVAREQRAPRIALLALAVGLGAAEVARRASLVDDSFISFRYARNLLRGEGLVFNPGEAVLGITNLGWTLAVAGLSGLSGLSPPHSALVLGPLAWVALLAATWRASRAGLDRPTPPLATALVALSWLVCSFGTTGLETVAAAALVVAGVDGLLRRRFAAAGTWMVLAAIVRLDHGLFLAFGGLVATWEGGWRGLRDYLASSPALLAVLAWTWWTYGEPVPNTAHAKGDGSYWSQGGVYLLSFWLTTHLLWVLPLAAWGWARGPRALAAFAVPALLAWNLYVAYVGGDFMIGRFLVPCVPLVLLACERAVADAGGARAALFAAWMGGTAVGLPLITPRQVEWYLADEGSVYPVVSLRPLVVDHHSFAMGNSLRVLVTERGLRPTIAAHGIGMIGYYSDLPLVDFLGLTDPVTAKVPVRRRGRPGHEKHAEHAHISASGVVLSQLPPYPPLERYTRLRAAAPHRTMRRWHVWQWGPEVVALREAAPELGIYDLPAYVQARRRDIPLTPPSRVRQDLELLDRVWYGRPGVDPSTRQAFVDGAVEGRVPVGAAPVEAPDDLEGPPGIP